MGGLSNAELAFVAVIIGVPLLALRLIGRSTWLERMVARRAHHKFSASSDADLSVDSVSGPSPFRGVVAVLFAVSLVCIGIAALGLMTLEGRYESYQSAPSFSPGIVTLVGELVLMLASGALMVMVLATQWAGHISSRTRKYRLVLLALGFLCLLFVVHQRANDRDVLAIPASWSTDHPDPTHLSARVDWRSLLPGLGVPAFVWLAAAAARLIARTSFAGPTGLDQAVRFHRRITPLGKILLILFVVTSPLFMSPLLVVPLLLYAALRFHMAEALAHNPILYLRSFQSDEAASAFAEVVVPIATGFGVLAGLVSTTQPELALRNKVSILNRGRFVEVSDDVWQSWVQSKLAACYVAIIDISDMKDNVRWELDAALRVRGSDRVILIDHGQPHAAGERLDSLPAYQRANRRHFRKALKHLLSGIAAGPESAAKAAPSAT